MNATAKLGLLVAGGFCFLYVAGDLLLPMGPGGAYVAELNKRPYTARDLAEEYGLKRGYKPRRGGAMSYLSTAS